MHEVFVKYGTPAIRLNEECLEVAKVCCKIERFGLDDHNPLQDIIVTNREKLHSELSDLAFAVKSMQAWVDSVPIGSHILRNPEDK